MHFTYPLCPGATITGVVIYENIAILARKILQVLRIPRIFVVLVSYTCTDGSKAISCFCQKLNRFLVHTYDRVFGIIWTAVHLKDVLHRCDESRVMAGWYAPALLQMRPVLVFFRMRPTCV